MQTFWKYIFATLFFGVLAIWIAVLSYSNKSLRLIVCDVGQGDAILASYGNLQILTDGGLPNGKVIGCLGRHMPFWDRTVEIVVSTHPDKDHYGGLIEVFKMYKVENFVTSGLNSSSQEYVVLQKAMQNERSRVMTVRDGQSVRLGLMQLDILHPSGEHVLSELSESKDLKSKNDFSIVSILSFGEFNALLTGDIEDKVSDLIAERLIALSSYPISFELLKVPHHGSKNGLSQKLLDVVHPELAVISLGKNNQYGHPHEEVVKILSESDAKILRTDILGDVVVESDGKSYWIK